MAFSFILHSFRMSNTVEGHALFKHPHHIITHRVSQSVCRHRQFLAAGEDLTTFIHYCSVLMSLQAILVAESVQ